MVQLCMTVKMVALASRFIFEVDMIMRAIMKSVAAASRTADRERGNTSEERLTLNKWQVPI